MIRAFTVPSSDSDVVCWWYDSTTFEYHHDAAFIQQWLRVYRLPTETVRLDSTSVSVYHDDVADDSLLQLGWSKEHRPDLRQFKLMLATLDPLGLPICCQPLAGNIADDGLYMPAYDAALAALDTSDLLVVGDSKMGALPTRGHITARGSRYLCVYRPACATSEIAEWVNEALTHSDDWLRLEHVERDTGELLLDASVYAFARTQAWSDPKTQQTHTWNERVLLVQARSSHRAVRRAVARRRVVGSGSR